MKVLQLCHSYNPPFLSVAKQYELLLQNSSFEVVTVFLKGENNKEVLEEMSGEVIFLNLKTSDLKGLKLKAIKKVREICSKADYEFCVAQRYKSIYLALHVKGLYVVGVAHIVDVFNNFFRKIFIKSKKNRLFLLGVSKAIRDDIKHSLPDYPENNISYLYNSLNYSDLRKELVEKDKARAFLGLPEDKFIFGNVGRLHEVKDQETLIRSFGGSYKNMPDSHLVLMGEGKLRRYLEGLVDELGLSHCVTFTGMVPDARLYLKAFDCFVLSSKFEGLPVALLEAFAAEIPCIASRCTGSEEAIEGVGWSFDVGDAASLSEHMQAVYKLTEDDRLQVQQRINEKVFSEYDVSAVSSYFKGLPFVSGVSG
ncbi:MAG: glycosyltransferase [Candidatus Pelagadaptatus aseana]|uniref:glycosyltransferase n=1 Tax=Candidatus Pelagadaptatus aseana TaxID=3120508 RepID=UPI0039B2FD90